MFSNKVCSISEFILYSQNAPQNVCNAKERDYLKLTQMLINPKTFPFCFSNSFPMERL